MGISFRVNNHRVEEIVNDIIDNFVKELDGAAKSLPQ
jgi:hypothetical protein